MKFPDILKEAIWHTTTPELYKSIISEGSILPEPPLHDSQRWGTSMGKAFYPYVRSIGGVSLFDFRGFNAKEYSNRFSCSSWAGFVPCKNQADAAIWIELDLLLIEDNFISTDKLLSDWKNSGEAARKIMPMIEAAHIGPIPVSAFKRVLIYEKSHGAFYDCEI